MSCPNCEKLQKELDGTKLELETLRNNIMETLPAVVELMELVEVEQK